MGNWFTSQWRDIKGNAKWDVAKWAVILGWPTMLTLIATTVAVFKGLSIATRVYILVPVISFLIQALIAIFYYARKRSQLNIEVTMDDGFSAFQSLTVTNLSEERLFTAECQIEASNRPPNYPKGMYRLGWGYDGKQPNSKIPQYASDQILLANFKGVDDSLSLLELGICKLAGQSTQMQWWARWNAEDSEDLPYFQLKVTVIAEGTRKPWVRHFLLTPETRLGPLSLNDVEVPV